MIPTKQTLHNLIEMIDASEINVLYHLLMKFVPEDSPLPDELEAISRAEKEMERGQYYKHEDIDWDNLDKMDI